MTQVCVTDSRKLKYRKVGLPLETYNFPLKFIYIYSENMKSV